MVGQMDPFNTTIQDQHCTIYTKKLIINTTIAQGWEKIKEVELDPKKMLKIYIAKKISAL